MAISNNRFVIIGTQAACYCVLHCEICYVLLKFGIKLSHWQEAENSTDTTCSFWDITADGLL